MSAAAELDDATRLRWLREEARRASRGHRIGVDELVSDMVASLGGSLVRVGSPRFAAVVARRRVADWQRRQMTIASREQPCAAEAASPAAEAEAPQELPDLGDFEAWRRHFERVIGRERGAVVHLADRRVKELLRRRARQLRREDPEAGLALLDLASAPIVAKGRAGPRLGRSA